MKKSKPSQRPFDAYKPPYASLWDVIECKGRIGRAGSFKERFAMWLARKVSSAIMRSPELRKELTLSLAGELDAYNKSKALDKLQTIPPAKNA